MSMAKGKQAQLIYDEETVFGATPGVPAAKVLPILSSGVTTKRELFKSNIIRSTRNATKPKRGKIDISGSISTELNPFMGTILKHLVGNSVVTTGAGPYVHTGKVGALPIGLTMEDGYSDLGHYILRNGNKFNKGSFEFNSDGVIPFALDILGASRTINAASFDATPLDLGHDPFEGAEMSIAEGGVSIAYVEQVKIDIENNLDGGVYVIGGGGKRREIPEGATLVSGTLTALFESVALLNKAIAYTESSLKITLSRGDGLGSAGNESLELFVPELIFEENDPGIPGPEGVKIELPFAAYYENAAAATSFQWILKNSQATV